MLVPSPATINDGSTDHIYTFQQQKQEGKSIVATWKELAAAAAITSTLKSKYNASDANLLRNVAQLNKKLAISDGSLVLATINVSAVYHKQHDIAALSLMGVTAKNMLLQASFWSNFFNQM